MLAGDTPNRRTPVTAALEVGSTPVIFGRSSSHFTRITRIFAAELRVDYSLRVVRDLMSLEVEDYGGNPGLRIPSLQTPEGTWFGALNICRELWRRSGARPRVVWPEDLDTALLSNAQELVLQAMSTEVSFVMSGGINASTLLPHQTKMRQALLNMLTWLEANAKSVLAALPPEREVSFLEVSLYCLVTHLEFRGVLPTSGYAELSAFCQRFAARPSVSETAFRFDT
jgi:glutathione S-transferase